ncbi:DUF945 family protein [Rhizobiaceae bacterium n13]|uniref:DUF945 family protein n=1 Tax=Ferirhizobium litorale TaxID=2927786 RepID=A0AAE3QD55_9HYPH|nr:DUF945 family protein [Fererhizobium litorale]MDI7861039.1 DUF945 family protein [Fererhizobium litorale]MDI7921186.1 DUF945 family protein [Fererhizobium litorale]
MTYYRRTRLMLAGAALVSLSGPAFAIDGTDLLNKINAAYAPQGHAITATSVKVDGSTVTLSGVGIARVGAPATDGTIGDVSLDGVEEDGQGGYGIASIKFPNINVTEDGVNLTAQDLSLTNVTIPADATQNSLSSLILYEKAQSGPVKFTKDGAEVFSLTGITSNLAKRDNASGLDFDFLASGLKGDVSRIDDPATREALQKLAITQVEGDVSVAGGWDLATGTVDLEEYALNLNDIGRLSLGFSFSGYTMELMRSLQESMKAIETAGANDDQAKQAAGLAVMGLAQQLNFNSASLSFEDASITSRLLDYAGKEQGVSGTQMAQTVKAMVPLMVAQLNIPELQNAISAAVTEFIDDPQSITISAEPESPVPFPMIMGAAMGAPNTLPKVLGVTVSANDQM